MTVVSASVTGTVDAQDGKPVAGATVYVSWARADALLPAVQTTTAADGSFAAPSPTGKVTAGWCVVSAPGLAVGGGRIIVAGPNQFQLSAPGSLSGTVVDAAGKPVSGFHIRVRGVQSQQPVSIGADPVGYVLVDLPGVSLLETQTDAAGKYTLNALPVGGSASIEVAENRYVNSYMPPVNVGTAPAPIVVRPGGTIAGKLLYDGGAAAPGVHVFVQSMNPGASYSETHTDATGGYVLQGLASDTYNVLFDFDAGSSWVAPAAVGVLAQEGATVNAPDVVATHGAIVTGKVTDSSTGSPIADAGVGAYGPERPQSTAAIIEDSTDSQGVYTLRVAPGQSQIYICEAPDGYLSPTGTPMTPVTAAAGDSKQVDFQLNAAQSIEGSAVDQAGKPVAGVTVSLNSTATGAFDPAGSPQGVASDSGEFKILNLATGSYKVAVSGAWSVTSPDQVNVPASGPVKIVLSPLKLADIIGRTIDPAGNAVPGVELDFMVMVPNGQFMTGSQVVVDSGQNGSFALPNLKPEDEVTVTIKKNGYALVSGGQIVASDGGFSIADPVLAPLNATVSGTVRDTSGNGVGGAWVAVAGPGGPALPMPADSKGRFELTGLTPGSVTIAAAGAGLAGSSDAVAGAKSSIVTVAPTNPSPSADINRGYKILQNLMSASASSDYYAESAIPLTMAAYDPDMALRILAESGQPVSDMTLAGIITLRAEVDPQAAAEWGYPRILKIQDPGQKAEAALTLGLAIAQTQPALAKTLYDLAKVSIPGLSSGYEGDFTNLQLPALAEALNLPEARADAESAVAQFKLAASSKSNDAGAAQQLNAFAAAANMDLPGDPTAKIATYQSPDGDQNMVNIILQIHPSNVAQIAHKLAGQNPSEWSLGKLDEVAITQVGPSNPQAALDLAQGISEPYFQSIVTADAADYQPLPLAEDLYKKAESEAATSQGGRATPAMIAAKAWLRDKALGRDLFGDALKCIQPTPLQDQPEIQSVPDFAFYYARADQAYSRVLLEKQFAVDRQGTDSGRGRLMRRDAIAMAAVDVDRALEMAYAIDDTNDRFDAVRKIAQYVLAPTSVRLTMPFDRWAASDTWSPGSPSDW